MKVKPKKVLTKEVIPDHMLLFAIMNKVVLPRDVRRQEMYLRDIGIINVI